MAINLFSATCARIGGCRNVGNPDSAAYHADRESFNAIFDLMFDAIFDAICLSCIDLEVDCNHFPL
jgi:hypothetical protein